MATVNLPVIGATDQRWVWAGGALVAGIVAYAWWARGQGGGGVAELEIDPSEGSIGGGRAPAPNPGGTVDETGGAPATNQEWTALAVDKLGQVGYEPGFVATALGKYLARRPLTADEVDVVRTAHGLVGRPPVGDFPITESPEPEPEQDTLSAPAGLTVDSVATTSVRLSWSAVPGATLYEIDRIGGPTRSTTATSRNWTGLKAGTTYSWRVRAVGPGGKSPWSGTATGKTTTSKSSKSSKSSSSKPKTTAPAKKYVTVVRFTTRNPPWNSTLSGIASRKGTTVAKLMQLNPSISDPNLIHPGQRIRYQ